MSQGNSQSTLAGPRPITADGHSFIDIDSAWTLQFYRACMFVPGQPTPVAWTHVVLAERLTDGYNCRNRRH